MASQTIIRTDTPPRPEERPMIWTEGSEALMRATDRVLITEGPADTGKSRAWFEKLHACLELYPGSRALYCRQTREACTESGLVTYENHVLPLGSYLLEGPKRNNRQVYRYDNGSELVVGGLDKPEKLFSTEYDIVFVQEVNEVVNEDTFAAFLRCLRYGRMPFAQLGADLNPTHELFWLYDWEVDGRARFINFKHSDNPSITKERLANLEVLRGSLRDRLLLGKRVAQVEGAYYGQLLYEARAAGRIGSFPYNPRYRVHVAMDLGIHDYQSLWFYQVDTQGRWYFIDYFEHRGEGQGYYATILEDRQRESRWSYGRIRLPHDAESRQKGEKVERPADTYRNRGYSLDIVPAVPAAVRIDAVRNVLPMAHFDATRCKLGLQRLAAYRQDKNIRTGVYGLPVHDENSHAANAMEYAVLGFTPEQEQSVKIGKPGV